MGPWEHTVNSHILVVFPFLLLFYCNQRRWGIPPPTDGVGNWLYLIQYGINLYFIRGCNVSLCCETLQLSLPCQSLYNRLLMGSRHAIVTIREKTSHLSISPYFVFLFFLFLLSINVLYFILQEFRSNLRKITNLQTYTDRVPWLFKNAFLKE